MGNQQEPTASIGPGEPDPFDYPFELEAEYFFGSMIRLEREKHGMTQADLAKALDEKCNIKLHPSAIAKMEQQDNDKPRSIRLNEAWAIAKIFDLDLDRMIVIPDHMSDVAAEAAQLAGKIDDLRVSYAHLLGRIRGCPPIWTADPTESSKASLARFKILDSLATIESFMEPNGGTSIREAILNSLDQGAPGTES